MRLRQLEAFRQIMLTGSTTRAAEVLGISQPGVSRLLAELENRIGFRLFERRSGRIFPTPEAASFYRHVEKSFVGLESLDRAAADIASNRGATLRVAAFPAISLEVAPQALSEFNRLNPDSYASLAVTNSPRVVDLVATLQADAGLTTLPVDHAGIVVEHEIHVECVCAVKPSHRLAAREKIDVRDLQHETLISLDAAFATTHRIREVLRRARVDPRIAAESSFSFSACEMVRHGLGIAIIDPVTALAFSGRGVAFRRFTPRIDFSIGVIRPAYKENSRACRNLLEILLPMLERLRYRPREASAGTAESV